MINEKNATYLYVCNVAGAVDNTDFDLMPNGSAQIVFSDTNKTEVGTKITAASNYRIVQRKVDGTFVFSPYFNLTTAGTVRVNTHVAPVEQTSFWGYDGTSNTTGFPTIVTGNTYSLHFVLNHTRNTYNNAPQIKTVPYKAQSTSQADLALGLQQQFIRTFSDTREFYPSIRCNRTADGTVAALGASTLLKVTKGSTTVLGYIKTATATTTLTATATSVTAGTVLSFPGSNGKTFTFTAAAAGSSAGGHAIYIGTHSVWVGSVTNTSTANGILIAAAINNAANTINTVATATEDTGVVTITYRDNYTNVAPMVTTCATDTGTVSTIAVTVATGDATSVKYKVSATANTTSFDLDVPWQGETAYIYGGTALTTNCGLATVTGYWGLKFTGIRQPFNPIEDSTVNQKVYFDVTSEDFGTLSEYKAIKMNPGIGTYEQVSYQEVYSQFLDKDTITSKRPRTKYRLESKEGTPYTLYNFTITNPTINFEAVGQSVSSRANITLAVDASLATDIAALTTVLGAV